MLLSTSPVIKLKEISKIKRKVVFKKMYFLIKLN